MVGRRSVHGRRRRFLDQAHARSQDQRRHARRLGSGSRRSTNPTSIRSSTTCVSPIRRRSRRSSRPAFKPGSSSQAPSQRTRRTSTPIAYNALPVGIGPFKYVRWQRGDHIEMEANPLYWRGRPKLDRVIYRIIPNRDTVVSTLQTGDADLWPGAAPAYVPRLRGLHGHRRSCANRAMRTAIWTSTSRIRRSATRSCDEPCCWRGIGGNRATRSRMAWAFYRTPSSRATSPFYDQRAWLHRVQSGRANALLDAAGWKRGPDGIRAKNGVRLSLDFVTNAGSPDTDRRIELMRAGWKEIGVSLVRQRG